MNNGLVERERKKKSFLNPTLLFDLYFLLSTLQQGGDAVKEEQSLHPLLPTSFH